MENAGKVTGKIIQRVEGIEDRYNDTYIYYGSIDEAQQYIVFFPGDVQDFRSEMEKHRDNYRYMEYCYENCATYLRDKYQDACVVIVKPSRMNFKTFAHYENFLAVYLYGGLEYQTERVDAWTHLSTLLHNLIHKEFGDNAETLSKMLTLPMRLVSFSKSCVVMNQLIVELPLLLLLPNKPREMWCAKNIKVITCLDHGLPGDSGAWITKEDGIKAAASWFNAIECHTTPYQTRDENRPWVAKEKKQFIELLRKHNANVTDIEYFQGEKGSVDGHFQLIKIFQTTSSAT